MFDTLWYMTWELFSLDEKNAWWLMMVIVALTMITFIYTNYKNRIAIAKINVDIFEIKNFLIATQTKKKPPLKVRRGRATNFTKRKKK